MELRRPSVAEMRLLDALGARWPSSPPNWVSQVLVRPLKDNGMGSLELQLPETPVGDRTFSARVAELMFKDRDGVDVIASLNVDQNGLPFELDVWKTDFSPLLEIPRVFATK